MVTFRKTETVFSWKTHSNNILLPLKNRKKKEKKKKKKQWNGHFYFKTFLTVLNIYIFYKHFQNNFISSNFFLNDKSFSTQ